MAATFDPTVPTMSPLPISMPPAPAPVDTHDYGPMIQASLWVLAGASGLLLWVRLYCKVMKRLIWWDDYLLMCAWIFLLISVIFVHETVLLGFGKPPTAYPSYEQLIFTAKLGGCGATFAIAATGISKTSFGVTMLRLTSGKTRKFIWAILISINFFLGLSGLFIWIECIPLEKTWDPSVPGACWNPVINPVYARFSATWSGTMDIALAMLPWKVIWNLKMDRKDKFGVAIAMSLGVFAGMTAYVKVSNMNIDPLSANFSSTGASLTIWASAEPAATIAAASIPVLRVLFKKNKTKSAKTTETPHTDPPTQESGLTQATEHIISDKEIALDRPRDEEHGLGKTWFESRTPDNVTPSAN